jgi:hypothetical protein
MSPHRGTSRAYLVRKLRQSGRSDLVRAVEAGRLTALEAACEMGWRRRPRPIGTGSPNRAKRREARMRALGIDGRPTGAQLQELWLGPCGDGSAFASDDERRAAWHRHRDFVMTSVGRRGRRPYAWWRYSAPSGLAYPGRDRERSVLYVEGLLTETEQADLLAYWREEFEKANAPDFVYHWNGRVLHGAVARRQHYQHIDLPLEEAVAYPRKIAPMRQ